MAVLVETLTTVGNHWNWTLLFARQPEPDLEFTEEELDQTTSTRAPRPLNPRKKPGGGGRTILLLLLLIIVGGGAYLATTEPEMLEELLSPYLGESTPPPVVAVKPKPVPPVPAAAPQAPAMQPAPNPGDPAQATGSPTAPAPMTTAMPQPQEAATPPVSAAIPALMFGEGQKVTIASDPTAPSGSIPLYTDASGSRPGPLVRTGTTLTILDGDLQPGGWMYYVRTDEGAKGWVPEKRLRLKP